MQASARVAIKKTRVEPRLTLIVRLYVSERLPFVAIPFRARMSRWAAIVCLPSRFGVSRSTSPHSNQSEEMGPLGVVCGERARGRAEVMHGLSCRVCANIATCSADAVVCHTGSLLTPTLSRGGGHQTLPRAVHTHETRQPSLLRLSHSIPDIQRGNQGKHPRRNGGAQCSACTTHGEAVTHPHTGQQQGWMQLRQERRRLDRTGQDRAGRLTATSITIGTAKNQRTTCITGTDRGEPTAPDTPRHRKRVCGRNRLRSPAAAHPHPHTHM